MASQKTTITRKGQITIPADIRRELGMSEGDQLDVELQGDTVIVRRASSVAARTGGALAKYRRSTPLTVEEERSLFEQAVAEEVSGI
jgi:AbrB family looped-hinge helix DNA binding protein